VAGPPNPEGIDVCGTSVVPAPFEACTTGMMINDANVWLCQGSAPSQPPPGYFLGADFVSNCVGSPSDAWWVLTDKPWAKCRAEENGKCPPGCEGTNGCSGPCDRL
jgi:hypothetical protein